MYTLVSNTDQISEAEEQWDLCVKALNDYQRWIDNHTYEIQIIDIIEQLLKRKSSGDLMDDDDVPDGEEISSFLSKKFKEFQDMRSYYINNVERFVSLFVEILEDQQFLYQFHSNSHDPLNRLHRKYKYFQVLFRSKAGIEYLKNCALFAPASSIQEPIYSFNELEKELSQIEQAQVEDNSKFVDYSVVFTKLFSEILAEFTKIPGIEIKRVYYQSYLFIKIYCKNISLANYSDYQSFKIIEFEQVIARIEVKRPIISKYVIDNAKLAANSVLTVLILLQVAIKVKKFKEDTTTRDFIELLSSISDLLDTIHKFRPSKGVENYIKAHLSTSSRLISLASGANNLLFSPILFCYQVNDFAIEAINGDDRASFVAVMSSISTISGTVLLTLGLANPLISISIVVGILFITLLTSPFLDTTRKKNIKRWLNNNYFGKKSSDDEDHLLEFSNPINIGFEWDHTAKRGRLIKEIRSIFSLLRPLNSNGSKDSSDVGNNIYLINFELENPSIPPKDFYIRIKFFNREGEEVTNPDLTAYAGEKGESWYLIPVSVKVRDNVIDSWKRNSENNWFMDQKIDLLHPYESRSQNNRITSYELKLLIKAGLHTHYYYQIQIISAAQDITEENYFDQNQLEKVLELNPFIISETGLLDTSIF